MSEITWSLTTESDPKKRYFFVIVLSRVEVTSQGFYKLWMFRIYCAEWEYHFRIYNYLLEAYILKKYNDGKESI